MNDLTKLMPDTESKNHEHISPEGVDERIVDRMEAFVTLTQGGKYRVYFGQDLEKPPSPMGKSRDSEEEAVKDMAMTLGFMAAMKIEPEKAVKALLDGMPKKPRE